MLKPVVSVVLTVYTASGSGCARGPATPWKRFRDLGSASSQNSAICRGASGPVAVDRMAVPQPADHAVKPARMALMTQSRLMSTDRARAVPVARQYRARGTLLEHKRCPL